MFNFMHALKRITLTVLLSVIVGLVSFETVKSIEKGYFSLIDIQELLSSSKNILIILIMICSYICSALLFAYYEHEDV